MTGILNSSYITRLVLNLLSIIFQLHRSMTCPFAFPIELINFKQVIYISSSKTVRWSRDILAAYHRCCIFSPDRVDTDSEIVCLRIHNLNHQIIVFRTLLWTPLLELDMEAKELI